MSSRDCQVGSVGRWLLIADRQAPAGAALLQVSAGAGPEEVRRFAALLGRRLVGRCIELGIAVGEFGIQGAVDAPRSLSFRVAGAALARLRLEEEGTHALVARSASREGAGRKRWFAGVSFTPVEETPAAELRPEDLEMVACRSGGPGGQNVNKRSTAVRIRHRPTGLTVRVDEGRRQSDNRRLAEERLARALGRAEAERAGRAAAEARQSHRQLVRGKAIRTYHLNRNGELEETR